MVIRHLDFSVSMAAERPKSTQLQSSPNFCRQCGSSMHRHAKICKVCGLKFDDAYWPKYGWELFPGANKFFCNGRLLTAPDTRLLSLTWIVLIAMGCIFFIFDAPYLWKNLHPAAPIIAGVVLTYTCRLLTVVSTSGNVIAAWHKANENP